MENENKEITISQTNSLITPDTINQYMKAFNIGGDLTEAERLQFTTIACAFQLNPFKREIYCIPFKDYKTGGKKLSLVIGYEVYLKRAERSGQLSGWKVWIEMNPARAIIEINRKDWKTYFRHEVFLDEYKQNNKMWQEKPYTMLKKVVIAQGFRLAFPCECGGMPYASEELPLTQEQEEKIAKINVQVEPVAQAEEVVAEVQKEIKKMDDTFNKALAVIPKADTQEKLAAISKRLDERFAEGLITAEQMEMIASKIKDQTAIIAEALIKKEFN